MEDLVDSFYGQSLAYDEGLAKGDAIFASALWRNFFQANPQVLPSQVLLMLTYTRANLVHISKLEKVAFLKGNFDFLPLNQIQK